MKRALLFLLAALVVALGPRALSEGAATPAPTPLTGLTSLTGASAQSNQGPAPAPTPAPASGFDAFRTVRTRNIFDPNRRPARVEAPSATPRPQTAAAPRSRSSALVLTGTVITEERTLAFFGGSRSEFNKVLTVGDSVAGFKVSAITPAGVTLDNGTKPTELAIGRYLNLDGSASTGAASELAPAEEPASAAGGNASPGSPSSPSTTASPAPAGDKNEVLRRMMERREKELSK